MSESKREQLMVKIEADGRLVQEWTEKGLQLGMAKCEAAIIEALDNDTRLFPGMIKALHAIAKMRAERCS